jgi:hypothetical protein
LGFVASLDDHRSAQDDGGEEEWFLHGCLLESVDSPVASSVREPVGGKLVRGCSGALKVNAERKRGDLREISTRMIADEGKPGPLPEIL